MNKKILSYERAVFKLKKMEIKQRIAKVGSRHHVTLGLSESAQSKLVQKNKKEINRLLTIIHLYKQLRRAYWVNKEK